MANNNWPKFKRILGNLMEAPLENLSSAASIAQEKKSVVHSDIKSGETRPDGGDQKSGEVRP